MDGGKIGTRCFYWRSKHLNTVCKEGQRRSQFAQHNPGLHLTLSLSKMSICTINYVLLFVEEKKEEYNSCNSFNTVADITGLINIAIKKSPLKRNCLFSEIESIVQERIFYSCALSKEQINHISSPFLPFYDHRTLELQGEPGSHLFLSVLPMQRCVL